MFKKVLTMGVLKKDKTNNRNPSLRKSKSKGNRLGWASIDKSEKVDLEEALSSKRVVRNTSNFAPLLVP